MAKLVCGVHATVLCRLHGVEKYKGDSVAPKRKCINLCTLLNKRENTDALSLKKMHHVGRSPVAKVPCKTNLFGSRFRRYIPQSWHVWLWQVKSLGNPIRECHRETSSARCLVSLTCSHTALGPEADTFSRRLINIGGIEEADRELQCISECCGRIRLRAVLLPLVCR